MLFYSKTVFVIGLLRFSYAQSSKEDTDGVLLGLDDLMIYDNKHSPQWDDLNKIPGFPGIQNLKMDIRSFLESAGLKGLDAPKTMETGDGGSARSDFYHALGFEAAAHGTKSNDIAPQVYNIPNPEKSELPEPPFPTIANSVPFVQSTLPGLEYKQAGLPHGIVTPTTAAQRSFYDRKLRRLSERRQRAIGRLERMGKLLSVYRAVGTRGYRAGTTKGGYPDPVVHINNPISNQRVPSVQRPLDKDEKVEAASQLSKHTNGGLQDHSYASKDSVGYDRGEECLNLT